MKTLALLAATAFCLPAFGSPSVSRAPLGPTEPRPPPLGLTVRGSALLRGGQRFRGIGVNYFDAFYRHLKKPEDTSYEAGFQALDEAKIPFARVCGCGFWPVEQKLYREDKAAFFRRLDDVVRSAQRHHIGLIPSLFWNTATVPDLVGEPVSAWGDPASKTRAYMKSYVRDVVARYKNSPAIWGWEFGNEFNLSASLPNAAQQRPPVWPGLGTAASRSEQDDVTFEIIRAAFVAFAREVRRYDADRLISTGDSLPRPSSWHQWHEKSWQPDTPEQQAQVLAADTPDPVSVVSIHAYEKSEASLREALATAHKLKKPLFVGEFGAPGPPEKSEQDFNSLLSVIEAGKVPLAALWVFDLQQQDATFNVTAGNARSYQLRAISAANARIRAAK